MKYNKSEIMKKAWELNKTTNHTFSICLKKAWAEAKNPHKSEKAVLIEKLEAIASQKNSYDNGYHYHTIIADWSNYGKSRTYLKIKETRDHSTHVKITDYGYFDNNAQTYVPAKYADINTDYARI